MGGCLLPPSCPKMNYGQCWIDYPYISTVHLISSNQPLHLFIRPPLLFTSSSMLTAYLTMPNYSSPSSSLKLNILLHTGKPRIDRTNVKDVVIKVGQQHLYDIDIIGEPKPSNEWTVEGKVSVRGSKSNWGGGESKIHSRKEGRDGGLWCQFQQSMDGTMCDERSVRKWFVTWFLVDSVELIYCHLKLASECVWDRKA